MRTVRGLPKNICMAKKQSEKCLICGTTDSKRFVRGLCTTHYNALNHQLATRFKTDEERLQAEQVLIDKGLLKPRKSGGRPELNDEFQKVLVILKRIESAQRQQETESQTEELHRKLKVAEETGDYPATKAEPKKKGSK